MTMRDGDLIYRAPLDSPRDEDFMIANHENNLTFELVVGNEWLSQELSVIEVEKVRDSLTAWLVIKKVSENAVD